MKSKRLNLKIILISVLALVMAFSVSALLWSNSARAAEGYELNIQGDVLEGITVTGSNVSVEIPATVKTVKERAFLGKTQVAEITFADGIELTEIGESAFYNTGITKIKLPASLEKIGAGAFGQNENLEYVTFGGNSVTEIGGSAFGNCAKLKYVVLPENAAEIDFCKVEGGEFTGNYGGYTFNGSKAYLIAKDRASYDSLLEAFEKPASSKATGDLDDETVGEAVLAGSEAAVTYPVTVKYMNEGEIEDEPLGQEICLSVDYLTIYAEGAWKEATTDEIGGRVSLTGKTWYCNSQLISGVAGATEALKAATGNSVEFYAAEASQEKHFVPAQNIVFDEDTSYDIATNKLAINNLLTRDSVRVTSNMEVVITKYSKPDGTVVYPSNVEDEEPLTVFHNAGTYEVTISYTGGSQTLSIVIAPKTVNLGDYGNLSWKIKGTTDLEDKYLYIYTTRDGKQYPSEEALSAEKMSKLGINSGSATNMTYVLYSVATNTGSATTIAIDEEGVVAYKVTYPQGTAGRTSTRNTYGTEQTYAGVYKATATITASDYNYLLVVSSAGASRGLEITDNKDGTFTVTKTWYVVNVNSRLVGADGKSDYSIPNGLIFGEDKSNFKFPQTSYKPQSSVEYITIQFTLDGESVSGIVNSTNFRQYVNESMPAGVYTMAVSIASVTDTEGVYHEFFSKQYTFTVAKANIKGLDAFNNPDSAKGGIKGKTFTYAWQNGVSHFYQETDATKAAWTTLVNALKVDRTGTVWSSSNYNKYYTDPVIGYKLDNSASAPYYDYDPEHPESYLLSTAAVQTYRVYYNISAPGYNDFVSTLTGKDKWSDFYFDVVNVMTVDAPTIASKTYTGETLKADVDLNSIYYTVQTNDGGIDVGTYEVVLRLNDPTHYMWSGQTLDNKTEYKSITFEIVINPNNSFTDKLRIKSWTQGKFNEEENVIEVKALYGSVTITIVNAADPDTILYEGANGTEELTALLKGLKEGSYQITASVKGNDNYTDINDSFIFLVFEKDGLPWWAVLLIVVGALGIVALVFFILHQKGVLQMLMGKVVIAMRAQATVDATIAAVRANKVAAESRKSVAKAEALDRIEQLRAEHRAEMAKPADEQAATLEEKAQVAAKSAEVMQKRAEDIKRRADAIKYSGYTTGNGEEQTGISESDIPDDLIPEDYDHPEGYGDEDYELPDDGDEE